MKHRIIAAALMLATTGSWAAAQNSYSPSRAPASEARTSEPAQAGVPVSPAYLIGEGDILRISVLHEPQFDETVEVRPDGKISVPLLSDVKVVGLTPSAARDDLTKKIEAFVKHPTVSVVVTEVRSKLVYIIGRVAHPGAYPLYTETTPAQLIAQAGGVTRHAKTKGVYVMRAGGNGKVKVNYKKVLQGKRVKHNWPLSAGDTVVVP